MTSTQIETEADAVVVIAGIPGAGKSTLIERSVDRSHAVVCDTEDLRRTHRAARVKAVRVAWHYARVLRAVLLSRAVPVVVHSRGTSVAARRGIALLARCRGRPAHLVLLVAEPADALDGQRRRGRTVAPTEMASHVARFAGLLADPADLARHEGWETVTVLGRDEAARVAHIGPPPIGRRTTQA